MVGNSTVGRLATGRKLSVGGVGDRKKKVRDRADEEHADGEKRGSDRTPDERV
jgi:hypothetical protein